MTVRRRQKKKKKKREEEKEEVDGQRGAAGRDEEEEEHEPRARGVAQGSLARAPFGVSLQKSAGDSGGGVG